MFFLSCISYFEIGHVRDMRHLVKSIFLPIPTIILILALISEKNIFTNILSSKLFVYLGKSSYVLYLIHLGPIGGIVYNKMGLGVITGLIALQIISLIIYLAWEKPMHKLLRSKN